MNGLFGFILFILGIVAVLSPNTAWYLSIGWKFKDAEPSDAALFMHRVGGIIGVVFGLILLVSSCAANFSGGADGKWASSFQQRLSEGEVERISFVIPENIILTGAEKQEVVRMIQEAKLEPFDTGDAYGSSGRGEITFVNGDKVELVLFGPSGGIELHPSERQKAFRIQSGELESWIRANITKM
ncbi:DUF6199 family natural product biosynthesis protein [Paenibacillus sp. NPDC058071]|uniref:DUF6199 family natural product biosynthesis protein n=1 Tax=Paenibacillus sp. NPDC058071 TaxID=3346326 RepID=UPI0036D7A278